MMRQTLFVSWCAALVVLVPVRDAAVCAEADEATPGGSDAR
jgi:hypothetical protein